MNTRAPPFGGSRGTDALDVVVWFGGNDGSTGWSQRILTVDGVKHRSGDDPHSKNSATASKLVSQFYRLPSPTVEQHADGTGTRSVLHSRLSSAASMASEVNASPHWIRRDKRTSTTDDCHTEDHVVNPFLTPPATIAHDETRSSSRASYKQVQPTSHRFESDARDSISLQLLKMVRMSDDTGDATRPPSGREGHARPRSGSRRPSSAVRRPTSAASHGSSASTITLAESRRGAGPKSVSDFPTIEMCRDLNFTLALSRAAAVSDRMESEARHQKQEMDRLLAGDTSEIKESPVTQSGRPLTATINALRSSLGTSIMHTIRSTNAHQMLDVKNKIGLSQRELARNMTTSQRAAAERLLYKHIPKDDADCLKLRQLLEESQTDFCQREIEANIDKFKRRAVRAKIELVNTVAKPTGSIRSRGLESSLTAALHGHRLHDDASSPSRSSTYIGRTVQQTKDIHIPVQSKIVVGGRSFMYSETFRPVHSK